MLSENAQNSMSTHPTMTCHSVSCKVSVHYKACIYHAALCPLNADAHSNGWVGPAMDCSPRMDGSQRRGRKGQPRDVSAQQQHTPAHAANTCMI